MAELKPKTTGYYRTDIREIISYEEGERQAEEVYIYYSFADNGIWISKTVGEPDFDFGRFLKSNRFDPGSMDPEEDEPLLDDGALEYQCGRFEVEGGMVIFTWKHSALETKELTWRLRITDSGEMVGDDADYLLKYVEESRKSNAGAKRSSR